MVNQRLHCTNRWNISEVNLPMNALDGLHDSAVNDQALAEITIRIDYTRLRIIYVTKICETTHDPTDRVNREKNDMKVFPSTIWWFIILPQDLFQLCYTQQRILHWLLVFWFKKKLTSMSVVTNEKHTRDQSSTTMHYARRPHKQFRLQSRERRSISYHDNHLTILKLFDH